MVKNKMDERIADMKIANKVIGMNKPCFFIAEAGVNHNGSLETAKKLVDAAAYAGADAVKFQTFKTENIVTREAKIVPYQERNIGKKKTQFEILKELELGENDFKEIKNYCDKKGIIFLSTPHSGEEDVKLLEKLNIPAYKIGSADLTNLPFLKLVAQKQKPVILSTGMGGIEEISEAIKAIKDAGNDEIMLLHCITNYPCATEDANLKAIKELRNTFNVLVGFSDHTMSIDMPAFARVLDAVIIEKHFTLSRSMPGADHKASIEPDELKEAIEKVRLIEKALGTGIKKPTKDEEETSKLVRKSIVAKKDIKKGEKITNENIAIKRPGTGLAPRHFEKIIGKTAKKEIKKDEMIMLDDLK